MSPKFASVVRHAAQILLLALAYFVTGRLALLLAIPPGFVTAIFPPVGVGVAATLVWGNRLALGVVVGSTVLNLSIATSAGGHLSWQGLGIALGIAVGSALHSLVGAALVRRFVGFPTALLDERSVLLFLLLGGPLACVVSATWGVGVLWIVQSVTTDQLAFHWWTWWVGDSTGVLIAAPLMLVLFGEPRAIWRGRYNTVGFPLIVCCAIMVAIFVRTSGAEQAGIQAKFFERSKLMAASIQFHFDLHYRAVRSIERLFVAAPQSKPADFRAFVAELRTIYPGAVAAAWLRRIRAEERNAFEREMAAEGYAAFSIKEKNAANELITAPQRDEYVVVTYIEPHEPNAKAMGFDGESESVRAEALLAARDSGEPAMTAPIELVQGTPGELGFVIFHPVYDGAPSNESERRRMLRGFAATVLRIDDWAAAALGAYSKDDYDMQIRDTTNPAHPRNFLGTIHSTHSAHSAGLVWRSNLQMAKRTFDITITPTETFLRRHRSMQSWMVLAGGLMQCGLLGAFLLVVSGRTQRVQQIVEQRTQELSAILDNAAEAIVTFGVTGHIERANPATATLFDYAPEQLPGRLLTDLIPDFDWTRDSKIGASREIAGIRRDGSPMVLEMALSKMDLRGRELFTCMLHDISARKRVEQLKDEFVSTVSHELRTPLTSISGSLGLIAGGVVGEVSSDVRELVDIAKTNAERLTMLVNDILDIEKLESGQVAFQYSRHDIRSLLKQSLAQNLGYAERFGVRLVLADEHAVDTPLHVHVDASRVLQVLANFISNAVKFSPENGQVQIVLETEGSSIRVSVKDDGPGIPNEFRSRVFQKFAQADGTDARKRGGTGLGLSISKVIVDRLGGTIGFESTVGVGTTFFFTLPRVDAPL